MGSRGGAWCLYGKEEERRVPLWMYPEERTHKGTAKDWNFTPQEKSPHQESNSAGMSPWIVSHRDTRKEISVLLFHNIWLDSSNWAKQEDITAAVTSEQAEMLVWASYWNTERRLGCLVAISSMAVSVTFRLPWLNTWPKLLQAGRLYGGWATVCHNGDDMAAETQGGTAQCTCSQETYGALCMYSAHLLLSMWTGTPAHIQGESSLFT